MCTYKGENFMDDKQRQNQTILSVLSFMCIVLACITIFSFIKIAMLSDKINNLNLVQNITKTEAKSVVVDQTLTEGSTSGSVVSAIDNARKSVVEVYATLSNGKSGGSGVIYLTSDNYTYIITNHHVIEDAYKFEVKTYDGVSYDATLVGGDATGDIAVLRITKTGLTLVGVRNITDSGEASNPLKVGESVYAIGNPLGTLGGSVTDGILSALSREITVSGQTFNVLQMTAAINSGNSGGGLFDATGALIGIVNAKVSASGVEGLAFALPVNDAKTLADQLISTYTFDTTTGNVLTYGYVANRANWGLSLKQYDEDTSVMGYYGYGTVTYKKGLYVTAVSSGSDCYKNGEGLAKDDYIESLTFNSETTSVLTVSELRAVLKKVNAGESITFNVRRNGEVKNISITATQYIYNPPTA
jgi:serine protease Do